MKNRKVKIISVSEVGLYFGIWKDEQSKVKDTDIVVVNRKNNRVVGCFRFIAPPIKVEETCPICGGKGKIDRKIQ